MSYKFPKVNLASEVTGNLPLANGGVNASLTASNGGIFYSTATAGAILSGTATAGQVLRSGASTAPTWSTATYPATAGTAGKVLISDGTNIVSSTPTFPNASATTRKIIVSDGTNWVASTETYAVPGTSGNVLTSNGTNWTSTTPAYILIQSQTAAASPTIDFTNLTSTYKTYLVVLTNVVPVTNGSGLLLTLSIDGGATYLATNYQRGIWSSAYNSATIANSNSTANLLAFSGTDNTASAGICGSMYLYGTQGSGYKRGTGQFFTLSGAAGLQGYTAGHQTTSSVVNAIRFAFNAGNISTGRFDLYGIT